VFHELCTSVCLCGLFIQPPAFFVCRRIRQNVRTNLIEPIKTKVAEEFASRALDPSTMTGVERVKHVYEW
jgi:hypothetical protein